MKTKSKIRIRWIIVAGLVLSGCVEDNAPPIPTCAELGAPDSTILLCNRQGLCSFDDMTCTRGDGSGSGSAK